MFVWFQMFLHFFFCCCWKFRINFSIKVSGEPWFVHPFSESNQKCCFGENKPFCRFVKVKLMQPNIHAQHTHLSTHTRILQRVSYQCCQVMCDRKLETDITDLIQVVCVRMCVCVERESIWPGLLRCYASSGNMFVVQYSDAVSWAIQFALANLQCSHVKEKVLVLVYVCHVRERHFERRVLGHKLYTLYTCTQMWMHCKCSVPLYT